MPKAATTVAKLLSEEFDWGVGEDGSEGDTGECCRDVLCLFCEFDKEPGDGGSTGSGGKSCCGVLCLSCSLCCEAGVEFAARDGVTRCRIFTATRFLCSEDRLLGTSSASSSSSFELI